MEWDGLGEGEGEREREREQCVREMCVRGGWNWCFFQVLIEGVGWEERARLYSLSMLRSNSDFGDVVTRCVHRWGVLTTNDEEQVASRRL